MQNHDPLFDSIKKLPKVPPDSSLFPSKPLSNSLTISNQPHLLFAVEDKPNPNNNSEQLQAKYEGLLNYLQQLEQENLELKRLSLQSKDIQDERSASLEIENLKLNERNQYQEEVFERETHTFKANLREKDYIIEDLTNKLESISLEMRTLSENNRKLEESAKISNHNFITISKKLTIYEQDNKSLLEQLMILDKEKRRFSVKWQQASEKLRGDSKKAVKVKELEGLLNKKTQEAIELKEKYVNTSVELRLSRETEAKYKSKIEKRLESLHDEVSRNQSMLSEKPQHDKPSDSVSLEALMKENGELYRNLNEYSAALERYRLQNQELEHKLKEVTVEVEILRQKSNALNNENEKLHVSYSQLLNETRCEEKQENLEQEHSEKNLDFIKKSEEYQEISSCIKDNNTLRAKLDCLILFIQENDPVRKEFIRIKGLYERLLRKYHILDKNAKNNKNALENSKSTNTGTKESTNLFNSVVSVAAKESVKKNTRFDESFIEPKKLFERTETKKKINKSFELDKESCKKYGCLEKEPKNVKKVNLTSFLRENKTNSYLLNYITKKN